MNGLQILVVEDDANIRRGLVDALESEGYEVVSASDGEQALSLYRQGEFQLILLDIMMPGCSGYEVCKRIRSQDEYTPIMMLTAKGEEIDKVVGLQLGADDYLAKPFGVHELFARVQALLRRSRLRNKDSGEDGPDVFCFGRGEVHVKEYRLVVQGRTIPLSQKELQLILTFHSHPGEVLDRDRLLNEVWGISYFGTTRTLDQHIARLRKKIEIDPANPQMICTVHGVGYRYELQRGFEGKGAIAPIEGS